MALVMNPTTKNNYGNDNGVDEDHFNVDDNDDNYAKHQEYDDA